MEIPFEILILIAELNSQTWIKMVNSIPSIGRYSLNIEIQSKLKFRFGQKVRTQIINLFQSVTENFFLLPNKSKHDLYELFDNQGNLICGGYYIDGKKHGL